MNECIGVICPYCGEENFIEPDPALGAEEYTEDCSVCCRPIVYRVHFSEDGSNVEARREDD